MGSDAVQDLTTNPDKILDMGTYVVPEEKEFSLSELNLQLSEFSKKYGTSNAEILKQRSAKY